MTANEQDWQGPGYRDLVAWRRAIELAANLYAVSAKWPREEMFGLTNQVRRAANSVAANIAEGRGRATNKDFARHCSIAYGSLCEVESHLYLAKRLGYLDEPTLQKLIAETTNVAKPLHGLLNRLNRTLDQEDQRQHRPNAQRPTPNAQTS